MNFADLSTQPNGFPLESDATLGFMQADYQAAVRGLAKAFGLDQVIISGCFVVGANVTEGWVLYDNDFVYVEAGVKQTYLFIEETWVQKANQDGTLLDRYKTKKAKFGTGAVLIAFDNLIRLDTITKLQDQIRNLQLGSEVILSGCAVSSVDTGLSTLAIASGYAIVESKYIAVPAYAGAYPAYLKPDSSWVTSVPAGGYIKFDPYTSKRYSDVMRKNTSPVGEVKMICTWLDRFDGTGLGKWEMEGWAIMNGSNGTFDMRSRVPLAYDSRVSDPGGNLWDAAYATLGATGGEKRHTLVEAEMPKHTHTGAAGATGAVTGDSYGLIKRSSAAESVTATGVDATGSGTEPDILNPPVHIPPAGNDQPHENRMPFKVLLFIQRI